MSIFTTVFAPVFGVLGLFGLASLLYPEFDGRINLGPFGALQPGSTLSAVEKKKFRVIGATLLLACVVLLVGGFMLNSGGGKKEDDVKPTPDSGPTSSSPSVTPSETQTISGAPVDSPPSTNGDASTPQDQHSTGAEHGGSLIVNIKMHRSGKVGVDTWSKGAMPGADVEVFDARGSQLNKGCYVQWTLYRQKKPIQSERSGACSSGGITMFNFSDGLEVGSYRLTAEVSTDSDISGSESYDFTVVDG